MTISLGSTAVTGMTLGSTPITGVYLGGTKLWPVASPSGVSVVQAIGINGNGSKSSTFNAAAGWAAPKAGNLLVSMLVVSSSGATVPSGWTPRLTTQSGTRSVYVYDRIADGTESSVTFGAFGAQLLEITGAAASPYVGPVQKAFASGSTYVLGPLTPTAPNCLAIGVAAWNISTQYGFSADAGWSLVTEGENLSFNSAMAYRVLDASMAPVQVSISGARDVSGGSTFLLIKPA